MSAGFRGQIGAAARFGVAAFAMLCLARASVASTEATPNFDAWRTRFEARATSQGLSGDTLHILLADVSPDPRVLDTLQRSRGFSPPIWDYLDAAVSQNRIDTGRQLSQRDGALLAQIERVYGIPPSIMLAVWGMETRFGTVTLDYDARRSLATLAFASPRRVLFEGQLVALGAMIQRGDVPADGAHSSWDGGLGQPQLMPNVFNETAVDWDRDGKRDIWNNEGDVLASIAHFLQLHGWRTGEPILVEASAPHSLPAALAHGRQSVTAWARNGVTPLDAAVPSDLGAKLMQPAGANGPAFLAFHNFDVLAGYNGSTRYGLAATLLAAAIDQRPQLKKAWPRAADELSHDDLREAQTLLAQLHYDVGDVDGIYGERTWRALNAFADDVRAPHVMYPNKTVLDALRARTRAN